MGARRRRGAAIVAALLASLGFAGAAQAAIGVPKRVADINPGPSSSSVLSVEPLGRYGYFKAYDGVNGVELWRTDGSTAGTKMVADIYAGPMSADPTDLTAVGDQIVFHAYEPVAGDELWVSDGTGPGTKRLANIRPGAASSQPRGLLRVGKQVLFRAEDGDGTEPWRTDGTKAGTAQVADINPGPGSSVGGFFFPEVLGGRAYFRATEPVAGSELWRSDLTEGGTELVAQVALPGSSNPSLITPVGNQLYFTADDGIVGRELWRSDGEPGGTTTLVDNLDGAATDSGVSQLAAFKGRVYMQGPSPGNGVELVRSNATGTNTEIVADINPVGDSDPQSLTPIGNRLFFSAVNGGGRELWVSDGVPGGTTEMVAEIDPGGSSICSVPYFTVLNGVLYFCADDGSSGNELWRSDGTGAGTFRTADINPAGSSNPTSLSVHGDTLYFAADDGSAGKELWALDTAAPETVVKDGPEPGEHVAERRPALKLSSPAVDLARFQCSNGGSFSKCAGLNGTGKTMKLDEGEQTVAVRAVDTRNNPDPSPEQLDFVVDTTAPKLRIKGRRLRIKRHRMIKLKLRCPASELTGPCRGRVKLKTRRRFQLGGKKRKVKLAKARFKLKPGSKKRIKLKLKGRKRKLVLSSAKARKVKATAKVHDRLKNKRKVAKRLKIRAP